MLPFLHHAPHLRRIHTDNIQHNTIKFHLQAYHPVCYSPQLDYPVRMLLFQYDSHTILFVSASTVPHFIFSTYASCFLPLPVSFLHTQYVQPSSLHKVRYFSSLTGHGNQRDGVVVGASASQSVDLEFISQVSSYQKTLKNGIHSFPAWRSAK